MSFFCGSNNTQAYTVNGIRSTGNTVSLDGSNLVEAACNCGLMTSVNNDMRKADPTGQHCLMTRDCCQTPSVAHETCYRAQCFATVRDVVASTGIPSSKYSISFQSRLGTEPWLQPYTDQELVRLATAGVRRLVVLCPAFVADCLETLEEIGLRGRKSFLKAGGTALTLVPCLNEHPLWLQALERMVTAKWSDAAT